MNQEIIEKFKQNFEELMKVREELENQIKEDASKEISNLITLNKFEASQKAVEYLQNLLEEVQLELDFSDVSESILNYKSKVNDLKNDQIDKVSTSSVATTPAQVISPTEKAPSKQKDVAQVASNKKNLKKQEITTLNTIYNFASVVKEHFPKHKFEVVKVENDNVEVMKKRKKYWLTATNPDFSKEDYFNILDEKCEKKNIGFVCSSDAEIENLKKIADEWVNASPVHKTKFLHINFTSYETLQKKEGQLFQTNSY